MKIIVIICILVFCTSAFSQKSETIRTGRPGASIDAYVVGTRVFQIQSGTIYDQARGLSEVEQYTFDNVLRYGINEKFEVSAVVNYSHLDLVAPNLNGISNTELGFRVNLRNKPESYITGIGFQFRLKLPWESPDFESSDVSMIATLALTQDLGSGYGLTYNIGGSENQATDKIIGNYTLALSKSINSKWGTFIEAYGSLDDGDYDMLVDTGLSYLCHNNLQYDLSLGGGKNDGLTTSFISVGFSWRLMP